MELTYEKIVNKNFALGLNKLVTNSNLPIKTMLILSNMYDSIVLEEKRYIELKRKLYTNNVQEVDGCIKFIDEDKAKMCQTKLIELNKSTFVINEEPIKFGTEDIDSYDLKLNVLELKALNDIIKII